MAKKIIILDEEKFEIKSLYQQGLTIKEIASQFGIEKRNISKILKGLTKTGRFVGMTVNDIFTENSTYNRTNLRTRVLKEKLIDYVCAICNINGYWNNKELKLQIDHINGIATDNRINNLRFLCPNCHSQTETFGTKNSATNKKNKIFEFPLAELKLIIRSSKSFSEIVKNIGMPVHGDCFRYLKQVIVENNIDISHITMRYQTQRNKNYDIPTDQLLVADSTYHSKTVKDRIIKEHLLFNKCSLCGLVPWWNNKELILQLDHINGKNNDHRLENLRLLCYNCHSQTDTFMLGARRLAAKKNDI